MVLGASRLAASVEVRTVGRARTTAREEGGACRAKVELPVPDDELAPTEGTARVDETMSPLEAMGSSGTEGKLVRGTLQIGTTALSQLGVLRLGAMCGLRPQRAVARYVTPVTVIREQA